MKTNQLDQFYTNPTVSDYLVDNLFQHFPSLKSYQIIEPSAGCGNFVNSLIKYGIPLKQIHAYDIAPFNYDFITKTDYLTQSIPFNEKQLMLGNPPFGNRGSLALKFLNKGLSECGVVAMIFPKTFQRYSIHKHVNPQARLIYEIPIEPNSFLVDNKEYSVNCVFQIWAHSCYKTYCTDKRLHEPKPTTSSDFTTFIHNNTKQTEKYFNQKKYQWNFAVYRQGYYNYQQKFYSPKNLKHNRQYLFIKFNHPIAQIIFDKIDFVKLSQTNTAVHGFSLTDLITAYNYQKQLQLFENYFFHLPISTQKQLIKSWHHINT